MLNAKDYIIYKLTGEFVTEYSDASSTCLMDLNTMDWSDTLLQASGLDRSKMPTLLSSVDIAGVVTAEAARLTGLCQDTPVVCGGGDGCCAAVGTGIVKEGFANCCLGTSSWISLATKKPIFDEDMTTFNFAHIVPGYIMPCGTMQTGGGALSWAVERLFAGVDGKPGDQKAIYDAVNREVRASAAGAGKLLFLPYLMGERSPRWNTKARGDFVGLTMAHNRGDILRAVMEGVGFNLDVILKAFRKSGSSIDELILIGGGARNESWQEILCDILNVTVKVPFELESATSMGAAITAGVGVGVFDNFDVTDRFIKIRKELSPNCENTAVYDEMKQLFEHAYQQLCPIFEQM
jgi:xylulokinase